ADGAAAAAGLHAGDRLLRVDGEPVRDFKVLRKLVQRAGDQPLRLTLARARGAAANIDPERHDLVLDDTVELDITPRRAPVHSLGFTPLGRELNEVVRGDSVLDSIRLGVACSFDMVKQIYLTLKRLVTGEVGTNNLGGIIRMGTVSYQAAQRGQAWFWYLLAMLSVNLAIVNLLPIPVLDGGHLLFVAIEKVKGSPVSSRIHGYSQIVGLVFVLMLVLFVTYNDILWLL
ncbi:MAG: RIP metalloprotease, partial [Planctomycetes bacterium]|nr:RIP metalloprotease [Planctomycetota bacterium]